jgi:hypothetical protein
MDAVIAVLHNCFVPLYLQQGITKSLEALDSLCRSVPIYRLAFRPDTAVIDVVLRAVGG